MSFRQITLVGNLGKDPIIRNLPSGGMVASCSVAVSERFTRSGDTEKTEKTYWFNLDIFQNGASGLVTAMVQPYLKKGQQVFVQGAPEEQEYTDKDGNKRRSFKVRVGGPGTTIRMLGKRDTNGHAEAPAEGGEGFAGPASDEIAPF